MGIVSGGQGNRAIQTELLAVMPGEVVERRSDSAWNERWRRIKPRLVGDSSAAGPPPRITPVAIVSILALFAVWRAIILLVAVAVERLHMQFEPFPAWLEEHSPWHYSARWDAGWYLSIAGQGYQHVPDGQSPIAFFPMLPMLMRGADWVLPGSLIFAGVVVTHLALLGALFYIYQTARLDFSETIAFRTLVFLLAFPASLFFSAIYTESLLLLGIAGTIYHARRGQWMFAALWGCFTALTKLIGLLLVLPIAMELLSQSRLNWRRPWVAFAVAGPITGTGMYLAYIHRLTGDFRTYFDAQTHWFRESFSPEPFLMLWDALRGTREPLHHYPSNVTGLHTEFLFMDMGFLFLFIGLGVYLWLRVQPSYGALVIFMALVPALSGSPLGLNRFMAILFPGFIVFALIPWQWLRTAILFAFVAGLSFTAFLWGSGFWAG